MNDNNMEKLISEIRESMFRDSNSQSGAIQCWMIEEILSKYTPAAVPSKSESGLREEILVWAENLYTISDDLPNMKRFYEGVNQAKTSALNILSRHPIPPDEIEPLEELAKRKGCELLQFGRMTANLYMQPLRLPDGNDKVIEGCSPLCTKDKCRAYLSSLPDKGVK